MPQCSEIYTAGLGGFIDYITILNISDLLYSLDLRILNTKHSVEQKIFSDTYTKSLQMISVLLTSVRVECVHWRAKDSYSIYSLTFPDKMSWLGVL